MCENIHQDHISNQIKYCEIPQLELQDVHHSSR